MIQHHSREASKDEMAREIDRCHAVIEQYEAEIAVLRAQPQPLEGAVKVKALEWDSYDASSLVGGYRVQRIDDKWEPLRDGYYMLPRRHGVVEAFNTADDAKAAAQADYERRIRSALSAPAGDGWQSLSCDEQFDLATQIAANLGYELTPEPPHPDTPRDNFNTPHPASPYQGDGR